MLSLRGSAIYSIFNPAILPSLIYSCLLLNLAIHVFNLTTYLILSFSHFRYRLSLVSHTVYLILLLCLADMVGVGVFMEDDQIYLWFTSTMDPVLYRNELCTLTLNYRVESISLVKGIPIQNTRYINRRKSMLRMWCVPHGTKTSFSSSYVTNSNFRVINTSRTSRQTNLQGLLGGPCCGSSIYSMRFKVQPGRCCYMGIYRGERVNQEDKKIQLPK